MHDCPKCGEACDCDGDDLWRDDVRQCFCECYADNENDIDFDPLADETNIPSQRSKRSQKRKHRPAAGQGGE